MHCITYCILLLTTLMFAESGYDLVYFKESVFVNVYLIFKYTSIMVLTTSQSLGSKGLVLNNLDEVVFSKIFIRDSKWPWS